MRLPPSISSHFRLISIPPCIHPSPRASPPACPPAHLPACVPASQPPSAPADATLLPCALDAGGLEAVLSGAAALLEASMIMPSRRLMASLMGPDMRKACRLRRCWQKPQGTAAERGR